MLRTFINFAKRDYRNVWFTLKELSNDRIPTWVIILYWSLLAPIGILLYPIVKLISLICIHRMIIKSRDEA